MSRILSRPIGLQSLRSLVRPNIQPSVSTARTYEAGTSAFHTNSVTPASSQDMSRENDNEDYFRYTRGRFVRNEVNEMKQRQVRFNMTKLVNVAANAVKSKSCVAIDPCADGLYNKTLLLTMDDGKQVIAKIPYPIAGPSCLTTASEVATMEFARNVLRTPAPEVYAWSSDTNNPVGAEYIIMEKANGVPLDSVYSRLEIKDRFEIMKTVAAYQKNWFDYDLPAYGSLFFAADLLHDKRPLAGPASKFAIGPIVGREWSDEGRLSTKFCRGPWNSLDEYLDAVGQKEKSCIQTLLRLPQPPTTLCGPGLYQPSREKKLRAVELYLQTFRFFLPTDLALGKPYLWHGDLHTENIFVNPAKPTEVTCIIDWQSTEAIPRFVQARQPCFLDFEGPQPKGLERPRLPANLKELPQEEREQAQRLYLQQSLVSLYRTWVNGRSPDAWKCFEFQETECFDMLLLARNLLIDGEAVFIANLLDMCKSGTPDIATEAVRFCDRTQQLPVSFSDEEEKQAEFEAERALAGMNAMRSIQESLGDLFPEKGVVRRDQYDEAKNALRQMKEQVIAEFARTEEDRALWQESWPFDD